MTKMPRNLAALLASLAGCSPGPSSAVIPTGQPQALRVECAAVGGMDATDDWVCPESVQVDCSDPDASVVQVLSPSDEVCDADMLTVTFDEPLTPGTHSIAVRSAQDEVLCSSEAVVVRGAELQLLPKELKLWPPNHKLHEISVADCVEVVGACPGEELDVRFIWASSDEAMDAKGDGHHAPDIVLSDNCQQLSLRSERQGPSDGRVYTLGVRLVDGAGEAHEASCIVSVDHDQRGQAATPSDDAYRLEFDGTIAGTPNCADDDEAVDEDDLR